jgi:hypothetical protein
MLLGQEYQGTAFTPNTRTALTALPDKVMITKDMQLAGALLHEMARATRCNNMYCLEGAWLVISRMSGYVEKCALHDKHSVRSMMQRRAVELHHVGIK